ncbi:MAG: hypothetical protein HY754_08135 [Nitrospirae bacterium]|nr:hypothetical protein [Nitrospirota bacterium]
MAVIQIKKLAVAINHLQKAIDMFLKNEDLLCVLTLAGAAEEILGQYAIMKRETLLLQSGRSLHQNHIHYILDPPGKMDC